MNIRCWVSMFIFFFLISCGNQKKESLEFLLQTWNGKEVLFPEDLTFTMKGKDTVDFSLSGKYKILTYVDSIGCISCKLQLGKWKTLMKEMDVAGKNSVKFLFFFSPEKRRDFLGTLKSEDFDYPVCLDDENRLNKLNHFPSEMAFQTFLLDKDNKVLAIGNPIHNPKVKELYLKIIRGEQIEQENASKQIITKVGIDRTSVSLGNFNWQEEQKATFTLKNTGDKLLVIQDVATSCGCTTVSYSKEPIQPGKETTLEVAYKAERPEHFAKTITVYCNVEHSPLTLKISGDAE
ncbi:MAG: DUF1573 domain-containing protein [Bacteroides sp.]|nr:DUF1573 domain-containing protein [Bacteroides sp.]